VVEYKTGDILNTNVEAMVNTVNCVGIMGRGIALQFKEAYPANYKAYKHACDGKKVQPGHMFIYETGLLTNPIFIINFPTKRHWRGKSRIEDIKTGLQDLKSVIQSRSIQSIAIPPLGSGLGGLNWGEVRDQIEMTLGGLKGVRIEVFEPNGTPISAKFQSKEVPTMTSGRAALVVLMHRYLGGLMDPFISLLEIHKLMYFMQEAGQPLRLKYTKAPYGPYAENLRHVLKVVEGHLVSGYRDGEDAPEKQLELVPGAVEDAESFLEDDNETRIRFDRVAKLVEGFETPFGLELLSTVHWVVTREGASSAKEAVERTYSWNERKKRFSPSHIHLAFKVLKQKGWIEKTA
jgi:O-acetyl-ADP-ribose deacetylase (regulator of RNase III)